MSHGPIMCKEKYHENEAVQFYCQECDICICQKCTVVSHNGHNMVDIQLAAEEQKMKLTELFSRIKAQAVVVETKIMEQTQLMKKSEDEISAAEKKVEETVEEIIRVATEHQAAIKSELTKVGEAQQRNHATKMEMFQLFATQLKSSLEYGEGVVQRNIGPEILQAGPALLSHCEELLDTQEIKVVKSRHVNYRVNEETMEGVKRLGEVVASYTDPSQSVAEGNGLKEAELGTEIYFTVTTRDFEANQYYDEEDEFAVEIIPPTENDETNGIEIQDFEDGTYTVCYKPNIIGLHEISVTINGKPLDGSPWSVPVTGHQYKALHSFGSFGKGQGEFDDVTGIAVSETTGNIAIADEDNKRVQLFDSGWNYVRTIGNKWVGKRISEPRSVAFTSSGNVIVIHGEATAVNKMFVFTERGQFIKQITLHLTDPQNVFVRPDGHMIVCDIGDDKVKVLSPDGTKLLQSFSGPDCDESPCFAVYHQAKFFVSYDDADCIKVFNREGEFLYDIGSGGSGDGQLDNPTGLAIDKFDNLIVCDNNNDRLQVFTLDGKFINYIQEGLRSPTSIAVTKDGVMFVSANTMENYIHVLH